ncbi:MAG: crotonase/enoyl-CoA hydratase family protein [Pseudomonadota bacterium]
MSPLVDYQERDHYALVQMDDGKANALGFDMLAQIGKALDRAEEANKVVIIGGRAGKFSAGFDLTVMGEGGDRVEDLLGKGSQLSLRLLQFPTPVILAVSGHALAMGALTLLSADYRIGIHGTYKIGLNEVAIGMTLPYFGIALAKERLAPSHFVEAVNLAKLYDAAGAVEVGFLDEVVSEEDLIMRAIAKAEEFAELDPQAHKHTKARTRETVIATLQEAIQREST